MHSSVLDASNAGAAPHSAADWMFSESGDLQTCLRDRIPELIQRPHSAHVQIAE